MGIEKAWYAFPQDQRMPLVNSTIKNKRFPNFRNFQIK